MKLLNQQKYQHLKKETTYAAPTVANPVETTPAKTEEATRPAEKVEEAKDKKEAIHQDAVDKSKLLTSSFT